MCLKDLFKKKEPEKPFEYGDNCLLHFAITDYPGTGSDLPGCVPDQELMINHVDGKIGGVSFRYLQDSEVTPARFEAEIRGAFAAMPKGRLTIGYSGHGTYEKDDSEPDGVREALYLWNGKFTDKRFVALCKEKPAELELVFFLDCCFSEGMSRNNPSYKKPRFMMTEPLPENFHVIRQAPGEVNDWLVISACAENQTASDAMFNGKPNGAFTFYAMKTLERGITYRQWMERIWAYLPSDRFEQIPHIDGPERLFDKKVFETE